MGPIFDNKGWLVHRVLILLLTIFYKPINCLNFTSYFWFSVQYNTKLHLQPNSCLRELSLLYTKPQRDFKSPPTIDVYLLRQITSLTTFLFGLYSIMTVTLGVVISWIKQNVCMCYNWLIIQIIIKYKHICFCRFVGEIR